MVEGVSVLGKNCCCKIMSFLKLHYKATSARKGLFACNVCVCVCVYTLTFQSVHVRVVRVNQEDFHSSFIFIISSSLPLEDKQNRFGFFT